MNAHRFLLSLNPAKLKLGLERTHLLLECCENPQNNLKIIQVAGTNGKGSVCAMLESIYREADYKTGLFTSPHLVRINERVRVNGLVVSDDKLEEFILLHQKDIVEIGASFFETLTVFAFWFFNQKQVDIAIMETGLGGRLDSVTACVPFVTVITKIALDHVEILGNSLKKITIEKAGIFKPDIPCISISQDPLATKTLISEAEKIECPLYFSEDSFMMDCNLPGDHQRKNAALAKMVTKESSLFPVTNSHIINGLKKVTWYGRYQILNKRPKVIFDVGHNHDGISAFLNTFANENINGMTHLVLALQKRKTIKKLAPVLSKLFDRIYCGEIHVKNYMEESELFKQLGSPANGQLIGEISQNNLAKIISRLNDQDCLVIIGSHYFGEAVSRTFKISFDNL